MHTCDRATTLTRWGITHSGGEGKEQSTLSHIANSGDSVPVLLRGVLKFTGFYALLWCIPHWQQHRYIVELMYGEQNEEGMLCVRAQAKLVELNKHISKLAAAGSYDSQQPACSVLQQISSRLRAIQMSTALLSCTALLL